MKLKRTNIQLVTLASAAMLAFVGCGDTTDGNGNGPGDMPMTTNVPDMNATNLPPGSVCTANSQCATGTFCVGDGTGNGSVCGDVNVGGIPVGGMCSVASDCLLNECEAGVCTEPTNPGVIVGTGNGCNWIDSPEACLDWNCLYEGGRTICRHNDQGVPNGNFGWTCQDDAASGQTICTTPGEVTDTDTQWDCNYSAATDTTTCLNTADLPDPDSPGNNGNGPFEWICEFPDANGGEVKICERTGGGPGTTCPSGNIEGFACTPSGVDVSGATVTISYTDCNGNPATTTVESDALGYFSAAGIPEGQVGLTIEKGPYSTSANVTVTADETASFTENNERLCFDPDATRIAVVTGRYDDIGLVLTDLGFNYDTYNGIGVWTGWDFLLDTAALDGYDIVFINCGAHPEDAFGMELTELQQIGTNLRNYVDSGHYIYASDWAYPFMEAAFPEKIDFRGEDLTNTDVMAGQLGMHAVAVVDSELRAYTNTDTALIDLNLPYWVVPVDVDGSVRQYLRGDARLLDDTVVPNVHFLVDFASGGGSAVFTSYHIHANEDVNSFFAFLALSFK